MSFAAENVLREVCSGWELEQLRLKCSSNGIEQAIDLAMLDEEMCAELLGAEAAALGGALQRAVGMAQPLKRGWAININRPGGCGGVVPCGGPALVQALPKAEPRPARAHGSLGAVVSPGEAHNLEASGTEPGPVRASRLLQTFTKNVMKQKP